MASQSAGDHQAATSDHVKRLTEVVQTKTHKLVEAKQTIAKQETQI
jgi:hypothetical protein